MSDFSKNYISMKLQWVYVDVACPGNELKLLMRECKNKIIKGSGLKCIN
jgi:hypothetical protein